MVVQGYKQNLFISWTVYEETDFEEVGTDLVELFFFWDENMMVYGQIFLTAACL